MKIDIVYTWVNGNDFLWMNKKNKTLKKYKMPISSDAGSNARWMDNQELRYSLRSINDYAPWVNNIFIVTDNQTPEWLNTNHPKIHIVDHKQIFPKDAKLPTFNSMAIETRLHHIKGLSEYFIYFNDDVFIGNHLKKTDFFTKKRKAIIFVSQRIIAIPRKKHTDPSLVRAEKLNEHQYSIIKNRQLLLKYLGKTSHYNLRHGPRSLIKSQLFEMESIFNTEIKKTMNSQFRNKENILLPYLFALYSIIKKTGKHKYIKALKRKTKISDWYYKNNPTRGYLYIILDIISIDIWIKRIFYFRPSMFCMNQYKSTQPEVFLKVKKFFETYYPQKSPFEK